MGVEDSGTTGEGGRSGGRRRRPSRPRRPRAVLLPDLLASAVESDPAATALVFEERTITYAALDERSSKLARLLIDRGVGPGDFVALALSRSDVSVTCLWAVAKTGAAFIPIDPTYPPDRVEYMVVDSEAVLGLTTPEFAQTLPSTVDWLVIGEAGTEQYIASQSAEPVAAEDRLRTLDAAHAAYMIYTSGSTGKPKGVVVTHTGLANFFQELLERFPLTAESRVLHLASPSFDPSIFEIILAVARGSALVIVPSTVLGGDELAALIRDNRVTHAFITPSALASVDHTDVDSLGTIFVGGEACPPELVRRWAPGRALHNLYGPSETTMTTSASEPMAAGARVTIGGPIRGMGAHILDSAMMPVPDGVAGELYLSGPALARGYHRRPALTADHFVANPFADAGTRMYRTGDLVRWRVEDGRRTMEFLGRNDFQVKIRGFRIELGEIDSALTDHPGIEFAVTVGRETPSGATALVSYVLPTSPADFDEKAITSFLAERLLRQMVPALLVRLDSIPLTPVGKLDRAALPAPVFDTADFREPSSELETTIAEIFGTLLGIDRVGADDDFFELGGNSLIATQLASRLGAATGVRVPPRMIFEGSTVAELAVRVQAGTSEAAHPPPRALPRPDRIPLSLAQQRMWFLNRFDTDSAANNIPAAIALDGDLDVPALTLAVADVIERHESLRTSYPEIDGIGYQLVHSAVDSGVELRYESIDGALAHDRVRSLAFGGFDVTSEVPLRLALLHVGEQKYVFVIVAHHISADGASIAPLVRDIMIAYSARAEGHSPEFAPLPVQYADYALWQRELLGADDDPESVGGRQIAFWRDALAGLPEQIDLPTDRPRPLDPTGIGRIVEFDVDSSITAELDRVARAQGASLFMAAHAVFAVLLYRLSDSVDVAIGAPTAGRGEEVLDDLIGMFVNTLVLRSVVDPAESFADLLARTREADLQAFANADLPFERLVEVLDPIRSGDRHPLFQTALFFQNHATLSLELPELSIEPLALGEVVSKFDLQLVLEERDTGSEDRSISGTFTYAADLFDDETVRRFADRFLAIVRQVVVDPTASVGDIDLLGDAEHAVISAQSAVGEVPVDDRAILDAFCAQVEATPDATAVVFGDVELTYRQFDSRVNRLARHLIGRGVGPDVLVGVSIRRSIDLVVAIYAVLRAGGAYVPIDPDLPAERMAHILATAQPLCVLTVLAETSSALSGSVVVAVDEVDLSELDESPVRIDEVVRTDHDGLAYVIFTSGSTGNPKGVAVSHRAVENQLVWMTQQYSLGRSDVYFQKTATTFDVSVWGFFLPLRVGATLVLATPDGHRDPEYISRSIARYAVTVTDFVPSMLSVFAAHARPAECATLRDVFVIGEALPPETVTDFAAISDARLHNLYGPTEAAVSVTSFQAQPEDTGTVPIGVAEWNVGALVLDRRLHPVPAGVQGELYLTGRQLARGYVARPDLTSDRFVADVTGSGARMYRTGDLVRRRSDGILEYIGRTDFQVKFRGQRIELGDIESALLKSVHVGQVAVLVVPIATGDQLVAYVVPAQGSTVEREDLTTFVKNLLPAYMIPATFVVLESFPLNSSGKLDRRALPAPSIESRAYRAPSTPVEGIVASAFSDVLGVDRVGLDDDFFDLGGNSLIATRLAARVGSAVGWHVPVRDLFEFSTVYSLAAAVMSRSNERALPTLGPVERPATVPLSYAQQRMWFLNRFDVDSAADNLPLAISLDGDLDVQALQAAIADIVHRHESLRTLYPEVDGRAQQLVLTENYPLPDIDPQQIAAGNMVAVLTAAATTPFDVTQEVPLRAWLYRLDERRHVLMVVVHHISGDAFSMGPLARDLVTAYSARTAGTAPGWLPLQVQYADYTLWQREVLGEEDDADSLMASQLEYWTTALAGIPDRIDLPTDRPRPAVASNAGASARFEIAPEVHTGLVGIARENGSTLFMVVHAALAVMLARLSAGDDVVVGTPIAGRGDAALDQLVGMFVNTLVLRTGVSPNESFAEVLRSVRDSDLEAFAHADVPFERLVEKLNPERSQARHPLFQIALSFQNTSTDSLELPGLTIAGVDIEDTTAKFDLQFTLSERADGDGVAAGIEGVITYATDLFDAESIDTLASRFDRVLSQVAVDPGVAVGDLELSAPSEVEQLLRAPVGTVEPRRLVDLMADAVAAHPDGTALELGDVSLTYRELDERSSLLADQLIRRGIGPGDAVAIAIVRSIESVTAVWAVAKTGAAFVPVDPNYPADRVEFMLSDSGADIGLTTADSREGLPAGLHWLLVEQLSSTADDAAGPFQARPGRVDDAAYYIYTSGSTGKPKGVVVTHRGLANFAAEQCDRYRLSSRSRSLHFASPSFDASVLELLLAVGSGSTLVVAPPMTYGGSDLETLLREQRITHTFLTPTVLGSLDPAAIGDVEVIVAGGEHCSPELMARFSEQVAFFNGYGPTETTIMTNISDALTREDLLSIGGPIRGMASYVLDSRLRPVPLGVTGELYIAGVQLARGYHCRHGLTSERFIANPFPGDGSRMYRTGDLVRWRAAPSGNVIEYVGRSDFQVKIRGFRIELGEIDSVIASYPGVDFVATIGKTLASGGTALVAYVRPVSGSVVDISELVAHVARAVPAHMVPSAVVVLDRVPLTPVGKLDRNALPDPVFDSLVSAEPTTATERALSEVFAEVLGVDRVGVDDSFFALGGDSIVSIQLVSRARARGLNFGPRDVFERKTVAGLAEIVESGVSVVLDELPGGGVGTIPLTPAVGFMIERTGGSDRFTQNLAVELPVGITTEQLVATLTAVVDRHDMLRAVLHADESGVRTLETRPPGTVDVESAVIRTTYSPTASADELAAIAAVALEESLSELDPAQGSVTRFAWLDPRTEEGDALGKAGRLIISAHHLVVDGVSWRIIVPDLIAAWVQVSSGSTPTLAAPGTSFRRWAHALRENARGAERQAELPYWRTVLDGIEMPVGSRQFDPSIDLAASVRKVHIELDEATTEALTTTVPTAFHAGVDDILLAALGLAVTRWRAERSSSVLVRLEGHGREEELVPGADLSRTVGWFTSIYPVRLELGSIDVEDAFVGGPGAGDLIKSVKEQLRAVPDKGLGYGLLRYMGDPEVAPPSAARAQISFNYLGRVSAADIPEGMAQYGWIPSGDLGDLSGVPDEDAPAMAPVDINAIVIGGRLTADFGFPDTLLTETEVRSLAELWRSTLESIVDHTGRPGSGGLTPSDVPLVDVGQRDIERWEAARTGVVDIWPLSPLQSGLLFHALVAESSTDVYTTQVQLYLGGDVDADRLRTAAERILSRYANLRTAFVRDSDGNAVQVVVDAVDVPWRTVDLVGESAETVNKATVDEVLREEQARGFDMTAPPLIRFTLIRTGVDSWVLAVTSHHILLDGWSMPVLMKDLLVLYATHGDTGALPRVRSYRNFLEWISTRDLTASLTAWKQAFDGIDEPTLLAQNAVSSGTALEIDEFKLVLDESATSRMSAAASRLGVTMNTLVQVAWGILLSRLMTRDDVVFGTTVSGRPAELDGIESMVGLFINTVPVRVDQNPRMTVAELVDRLQREQSTLLDHHYVGFTDIAEAVGDGALFDTLVVFESYPIDTSGLSAASSIDGMYVTGVETKDATHYPLTLVVMADTTVTFTLKYLKNLFGSGDAAEITARFARVLDTIVEDDTRPIGSIDILDPDERTLVLETWSGSADIAAVDETLISLFENRVRISPDAVAVVFAGSRITYRELDEQANRLARVLIDGGAAPERLVAIALPRGVDMVVGLIAVLKSGAGYLPVDTTLPAERARFMLEDARPVALLTDSDGSASMADFGVPVIDMHRSGMNDRAADPIGAGDRPSGSSSARSLAYVIYTSGSTGVPKGVAVPNENVVRLFRNTHALFDFRETDVWTMFHSFAFDFSVWEIWGPLLHGGSLVIVDYDTSRSPQEFANLVSSENVTVLSQTPSAFYQFVEADLLAGHRSDSLRHVVFGGEALEIGKLSAWFDRHGSSDPVLTNMYGITETTVHVTHHAVDPTRSEARSPIGTAVDGLGTYVLDQGLRPVPVGVIGEIYVRGGQLARGYLGRSALTSGRFVADPFSNEGSAMYRTGDLARWTEEGTLDYLGRSDSQVQLRGFRIELGEIDIALMSAPGVKQAVSVMREDSQLGARIVGYVVGDGAQSTEDIRAHLAARLASYMVPDSLVVLDSLPLTVNGKLDRRALPDPGVQRLEYREARTIWETAVAASVGDVLGIEKVGLDDRFVDLGGNSLTAAKLASQIRSRCEAPVSVQWILTEPTVELLAQRIQSSVESAEADAPADSLAAVFPIRADGDQPSLFCVHPMVGLAWNYTALGESLAVGRPVYGLQLPRLTANMPRVENLVEQAQLYIQEILRVQPSGPYHLLGWSFGGVLAHAIAVALQTLGHEVATLAMLDSLPRVDESAFAQEFSENLRALGIDVGTDPATSFVDDSVRAQIVAVVRSQVGLFEDEQVLELLDEAVASPARINGYRPRVFAGDLLYFSAAQDHPTPADAAEHWIDFVAGEITEIAVDASHGEMTTAESLATVGRELDAWMLHNERR